MASRVDLHLDEEAAERYSLGNLSARRVVEIEEHLLICEPCQRSVAAADAYVAAMRDAAAKLQKADEKPKRKAVGKMAVAKKTVSGKHLTADS
jgi:anti-sigma factor RsiW